MSGVALLEALREKLPPSKFETWFGAAAIVDGPPDSCVVAVPNAFTCSWICTHLRGEFADWSATTGRRVELVIDERLRPAHRPETAGGGEASALEDVKLGHAAYQRELSAGVVVKLLAERGFWSLTASSQREPYLVEDLGGTLEIIPTAGGGSGVYEACVFTGLVSLWADGSRADPMVETSLRRLAATLKLSWSGRTAEQLRTAIERLKTTNYRTTIQSETGGADRLFSLLDEVATCWRGAPSTPRRHVTAVFSRTAFEILCTPRVLRRVDLDVLRQLGPQRDLARRLFLFLEAQSGHSLRDGEREIVERVIDGRLAATLGSGLAVPRFARQLDRAGEAIAEVSPRYRSVSVIPRRKRALAPGDPRSALRVVRHARARRA